MRKSKRVLFKPKVFGFNPYTDQVPAIKQIMEETGQESEAPVLRMLLDEALRARRQKAAGVQPPQQPPPAQELGQCLETIRVLLLKLICQGETGFRIESISLELMQEALAEARAGRVGMWETLVKPSLRERGRSAQEIGSLFEAQIKKVGNSLMGSLLNLRISYWRRRKLRSERLRLISLARRRCFSKMASRATKETLIFHSECR